MAPEPREREGEVGTSSEVDLVGVLAELAQLLARVLLGLLRAVVAVEGPLVAADDAAREWNEVVRRVRSCTCGTRRARGESESDAPVPVDLVLVRLALVLLVLGVRVRVRVVVARVVRVVLLAVLLRVVRRLEVVADVLGVLRAQRGPGEVSEPLAADERGDAKRERVRTLCVSSVKRGLCSAAL